MFQLADQVQVDQAFEAKPKIPRTPPGLQKWSNFAQFLLFQMSLLYIMYYLIKYDLYFGTIISH